MCFYQLFKLLHSVFGNNITAQWVENFPSTMKKVQDQLLVTILNLLTILPAISVAHCTISKIFCIERIGSKTTSKRCVHVEFPNQLLIVNHELDKSASNIWILHMRTR